MNEELSILVFILIIHWSIIITPVLNSGKWCMAAINVSIQLVYASCFIYGIIIGEPSSSLAYYFYFIFIIVSHAVINSIQLFFYFSKNRFTLISKEVNIYDWVNFWNNYNHLIKVLQKQIDKDYLSLIKIAVDGSPRAWLIFRKEFQNWIAKEKQSLNENEINLIEKLLDELVVKTDLIFKNAL